MNSRNFQHRSCHLKVISGLISAAELSNDPGKFAESRRDALKSLARYLKLDLNCTRDDLSTPNFI